MRVVISTNLSEIFFILRRNEQDMITNVHWSSCKVPVIIVRFLMKLKFSRQFQKAVKYQISLKSIQWEPSCFMWTNGQTDRRQTDRNDEANSHFSQFRERP